MLKKLLLISLLSSCSSFSESKKDKLERSCQTNTDNSIEHRHISIAATANNKGLFKCLNNYAKHTEDALEMNSCFNIKVTKHGQVSSAYVYGMDQEIPNDLKWCIEQQLWTMDLKTLRPSENITVTFKVNLKAQK